MLGEPLLVALAVLVLHMLRLLELTLPVELKSFLVVAPAIFLKAVSADRRFYLLPVRMKLPLEAKETR